MPPSGNYHCPGLLGDEQPMEIAFLTLVDPAGTSGQNIYSRSVATSLARRSDIDLTLICPTPRGELPERLRAAVSNVEYLPRKRSGDLRWHLRIQPVLLRMLSRIHDEFGLWGLVTPLRPALLVPPLFARWNDIPQVLLVEGLVAKNAAAAVSIPGMETIATLVSVLNAAGSAGIYTADETSRNWITALPGVGTDVEVFSHGVDTSLFAPRDRAAARQRIGVDLDDRFTVGFVGSYKTYHCLPTLVDAVATADLENVQLLLVGDGPEFESVRNLVAERSLGNRVCMPGFVDHESVADYISACDAMYGVIAPDRSGSPMKVYEYLACGRPVIVRRTPEFEFVEQQGIGETISGVDAGHVRAAIQRLRSRPREQREEMGRMAHEYVSASGRTWDALAEKIAGKIQSRA
jgi:glycosyltransferase involved in cell wall biosynthesis